MEKHFNLVDQPWIPVVAHGLVCLRDIFERTEYVELGGTPLEKIAVMKLLQAIAQEAVTPATAEQWAEIGIAGLAQACLAHLAKYHDRFDLFGKHPFLQMPTVATARVASFSGLLPHVATGNTTVLVQSQLAREVTDAEKAMIILTQMGLCLGGKRTDNSVVLTPGYVGKQNAKGRPSSGRAGPSLGFMGFLHNFVFTDSLLKTIWLNLMTLENIRDMGIFTAAVGVAPWVQMPVGEDCPVAQRLRTSLMGRLIPMARFCLIADSGLHYSEGIAHDGYREGMFDPSVAVDYSSKKPRVLWTNPDRRPWRELTALLGFIASDQTKGFECTQLKVATERIRDVAQEFVIWSGGLRVSSNAGEQYTSGADDYVDSVIRLREDMLGESWFTRMKLEVERLDIMSRQLYAAVINYHKKLTSEGADMAAQATQTFWEIAEQDFQALIDSCANPEDEATHQGLMQRFRSYQYRVYDQFCPNDTARQMAAWAECRPGQQKKTKQEA